jgi:hypothetical protein
VTCPWCTSETTKEPRHGRRTRRHKCPHGTWCPRAEARLQHNNHYPMGGRDWCAACHRAYWQREEGIR